MTAFEPLRSFTMFAVVCPLGSNPVIERRFGKWLFYVYLVLYPCYDLARKGGCHGAIVAIGVG